MEKLSIKFLKQKSTLFTEFLREVDSHSISLFLTLSMGITFIDIEPFWESTFFSGLSFLGLLFFKNIKESKPFWLLYFFSYLFYLYVEGIDIDNHKYLYCYWLLCIIFYLYHQSRVTLKNSASLLIGVSFIFATFWKLYGGEYLDGSFFEITNIYDYRLQKFSTLFLGYDAYIGKINTFLTRDYVINNFTPVSYSSKILVTPENRLFSLIVSYYTVLLEGFIGGLFIFKTFKNDKGLSDITLLIFILTVYWLMSVTGFAAILIAMGIIQARKRFIPYYLLSLLVITFLNWPLV